MDICLHILYMTSYEKKVLKILNILKKQHQDTDKLIYIEIM